jgi:hypothetical protein
MMDKPDMPGREPKRYGLYAKIKIPLATMNLIIGGLAALLLIALVLGIIIGPG